MGENTEAQNQLESQPRLEQGDLRQRLEGKFNQVFQGPQISVDILFSYHGTHEDLERLDERFKGSDFDIYIPESFGWKPEYLKTFRYASSGKKGLRKLIEELGENKVSPSFPKTLEIIHRSCKPITIIDVPFGDPLVERSEKVSDYKPPLTGELPEALDYTRDFLSNNADYQNAREKYMPDAITPEKVEELLKNYPSLRNKQAISILLSLGSAHAPMPPDYSEYSFTDEGIVKSKFGKEVDDELAARIFLEGTFKPLVEAWRILLTRDYIKISKLERIIFSQFKFSGEDKKDVEAIFNYVKEHQDFIPPTMPLMLFNEVLKKKGITIPRTEQELDEFLARPEFTQNQSVQRQ